MFFPLLIPVVFGGNIEASGLQSFGVYVHYGHVLTQLVDTII
jgi:hypothetical protein